MAKRKYFFDRVLKSFSREESVKYLDENVFNSEDFDRHVSMTSEAINIDKDVILDVLRFYITEVFVFLNTVQKVKKAISVYGFFYFYVEKGKRV